MFYRLGKSTGSSRVVASLSTSLNDLQRFTNYSITVAASTKAGVGVASDAVICATEEDGKCDYFLLKFLINCKKYFVFVIKM